MNNGMLVPCCEPVRAMSSSQSAIGNLTRQVNQWGSAALFRLCWISPFCAPVFLVGPFAWL
jgi:hypothetical protein